MHGLLPGKEVGGGHSAKRNSVMEDTMHGVGSRRMEDWAGKV